MDQVKNFLYSHDVFNMTPKLKNPLELELGNKTLAKTVRIAF